jgi:hypothetical protein
VVGIIGLLVAQREWSDDLSGKSDCAIGYLRVVLSNRSGGYLTFCGEPKVFHALFRAANHLNIFKFHKNDNDSGRTISICLAA